MTPKHLIMGAASLALSLTVVALAAANRNGGSTAFAQLGTPQPSYSCASIHFGMDDSTLEALTYDCSTTATMANATVSGVTVESSTLTKAYCGDKNSAEYAIRLGTSSAKGSLSITFSESVVGCTVYALGYGTDSTKVTVNGVSKELTSNYTEMATKANASEVEYVPYSWTFDATNTLTIEGQNKTKCRFFVADIAIRVAN